jgi:VIT1/CCC1 family predicted Fe2+/Mn2+ transporter
MAGATAMATGEYVSVSSQYDAEKSDLEHQKDKSLHNPNHEIHDLTKLYVKYGLEEELARIVAEKLINYKADNLETGIAMLRSSVSNPLQAAFASATSFIIGGVLPLLATIVVPHSFAITGVVFSTLLSLAVLGALGAIVGNTPILQPTLRIIFWGAISLGLTAAVGNIFKITP